MGAISPTSRMFGTLFAQEAPPAPVIRPVVPRKKVLLIGEGEFSFALAYAQKHPDYEIVATEYCSGKEVREKYPKAEANLRALHFLPNVRVITKIDATKLGRYKNIQGVFDKVIFNFPHTGQRDGSTAEMIDGFFRAVKNVLKADGKVQMGVVDTVHFDGRYVLWSAATHNRFKLTKRKLWDRTGFYKEHDYIHVSTQRDRMITANRCLKYTFRFDPTADSEDGFLHSSALSSDAGRLNHLSSVRRCLGTGKAYMTNRKRNRTIIVSKYKSSRKAFQLVGKLITKNKLKKAKKITIRLIKANPQNHVYRDMLETIKEQQAFLREG